MDKKVVSNKSNLKHKADKVKMFDKMSRFKGNNIKRDRVDQQDPKINKKLDQFQNYSNRNYKLIQAIIIMLLDRAYNCRISQENKITDSIKNGLKRKIIH